jgi:hypothetical protein
MGKGADEEKWTRAVSRWFTCCLGATTEKMRLGLVGNFLPLLFPRVLLACNFFSGTVGPTPAVGP